MYGTDKRPGERKKFKRTIIRVYLHVVYNGGQSKRYIKIMSVVTSINKFVMYMADTRILHTNVMYSNLIQTSKAPRQGFTAVRTWRYLVKSVQ